MSTPLWESLTVTSSNQIVEFCRSAFSRHSEHWPIRENVLGEEFTTHFGLDSILTFNDVAQLCRDRLQIPVSLVPLEKRMKGCNASYGGRSEIVISTNQDHPAADVHTLLHELREILERAFSELGHPTVSAEESDLEERAEHFAVAVQVSAAHRMLPWLADRISELEQRWLRGCAYVLLCAGAMFYVFSCISLPRLEDAFAAQRVPK